MLPKFEAKILGRGQSAKHGLFALSARYLHGYTIERFIVTNLDRDSLWAAVFCRDDVIVDIGVDDMRTSKAANGQTRDPDGASVAKNFVA